VPSALRRALAAAGISLAWLCTPGAKIKARAPRRAAPCCATHAAAPFCVFVRAIAHLAPLTPPSAASQGVGFDDFLNDTSVQAGAGGKRSARGAIVATSFDAFVKDVAVKAGGSKASGPITNFDHFLKRHVTKARVVLAAARGVLQLNA
jgi:hypothetical protein